MKVFQVSKYPPPFFDVVYSFFAPNCAFYGQWHIFLKNELQCILNICSNVNGVFRFPLVFLQLNPNNKQIQIQISWQEPSSQSLVLFQLWNVLLGVRIVPGLHVGFPPLRSVFWHACFISMNYIWFFFPILMIGHIIMHQLKQWRRKRF